MQWDATENAGFTTGKPWLKVKPNYKSINTEESLKDPDSVFHYYQKLIKLRHQNDIIVYGTYDEIYPEDKNFYVYTRTLDHQKLFVALNFTKESHPLHIPNGLDLSGAKLLISNYDKALIICDQFVLLKNIVFLELFFFTKAFIRHYGFDINFHLVKNDYHSLLSNLYF